MSVGCRHLLKKMNNKEIELYHIQYWFMKNREMLTKNYRKLYDVIFEIYKKHYKEGRALNQDLMSIERAFEATLKKFTH
jgi:hypothetical protein